ncbi:ParB N-terminal domain-containing protein (plasmid) [Myxococcus sp. MxC21-1]|uniref:ParB/RepB/Spo0J family partition protein n=1 Tax=Myxococcus sp. MxC21-1 TaxID=3041439 RepID=UPI00293050E9|nr:ParB N-terminal domain-containing protein [Myxococcus sp. MxC21-1]WNZ66248.1 ParB N-terminal domain-containing protein [Myxococcus sp. MxC21-1]
MKAHPGVTAPSGGPLPYEPGRAYGHLATVDIPIGLLIRNKFQPRGWLNPVVVRRIAESIKATAQLQTVPVTPRGDHFMVIGGETRWRAVELLHAEAPEEDKAKYATLRCEICIGVSDVECARRALDENIAREDLNAMDIGAQLATIREQNDLRDAKAVAEFINMDVRNVRTLLALHDNCPPLIHAAVRGQDLKPFLRPDNELVTEDGGAWSPPLDARRDSERMLARDGGIEFNKLYLHFQKTKPGKANSETAERIIRALDEKWPVATIKNYVQSTVNKAKSPTTRVPRGIVRNDGATLSINLRQLAAAPDAEVEAIRAQIEQVIADRAKYRKQSSDDSSSTAQVVEPVRDDDGP